LTLIHVGLLAVAIVVMDIALYATLARGERGTADDGLRAQAAHAASTLEENNGQLRFRSDNPPADISQGIAFNVAVVTRSSITQQGPQPLSSDTLRQIAETVSSSGLSVFKDLTTAQGAQRAYAEPLHQGGQGSVLVVSRSVNELESSLTRATLALAIFSLLVIVIGGVLAHALAGRVLTPVRRIAGMARTLSRDNLHKRVDLAVPPDELGELVDTFNGMLARLEASFESLSRFTADASHELRTPLALIHGELELALEHTRTPEEYQAVLRTIQEEVERISRMADQLLLLARADAGALQPQLRPVDVVDLLEETAGRWAARAELRGLGLHVRTPATGTVSADPDLVRRVLDNLLENALRHSPERGQVVLSAKHNDGHWDLDVSDEGAGVPKPAREHLFERFSRGDIARTRGDGGAGLGLAVSQAIAVAHGGSLELIDVKAPGAIFRLRLPG
jgi:heavy metal sensor kinase